MLLGGKAKKESWTEEKREKTTHIQTDPKRRK